MFSKKINKKIAETKRQENDNTHLNLTSEQLSKLHRRYDLTYSNNDRASPSSQRSHSRLAAGFSTNQNFNSNPSSYASSQDHYNKQILNGSSVGQKNVQDEHEDEDPDLDLAHLQYSTDEIVEEFDVDNVELRYPTQGYPSGENLVQVNSSSSLRKSPSSQRNNSQKQEGSSLVNSELEQRSRLKRSTDKLLTKKKVIDNQSTKNSEGERDELRENVGSNSRYFVDSINYPNDEQHYISRSKERNSAGGRSNQQQRASRKPSGNALERQPSMITFMDQSPQPQPVLGNMDSLTNSIVNMSQFTRSNSNANIDHQLGPNRILTNTNPSFTLTTGGRQLLQGSNGSSRDVRDVIPLPIEIPDSVTDADAFRRYLSVRRGASPFLSNESDEDVDNDEQAESSTLESLGRPNQRTSRIGSAEILASTTSTRLRSQIFQPTGGSGMFQSQQITQSEGGPGGDDIKCPQQQQLYCTQATQYLKKTTSLSHAIMTLALLSASAAQLRFVVAYSHVHSYPTLNYFLICSCIIIEILVGIGFVIMARFDFQDSFVENMHSYLIFGLFVVTIANVIVAAFALDDHICDSVMKKIAPPITVDQQQQQQQYALDNQL